MSLTRDWTPLTHVSTFPSTTPASTTSPARGATNSPTSPARGVTLTSATLATTALPARGATLTSTTPASPVLSALRTSGCATTGVPSTSLVRCLGGADTPPAHPPRAPAAGVPLGYTFHDERVKTDAAPALRKLTGVFPDLTLRVCGCPSVSGYLLQCVAENHTPSFKPTATYSDHRGDWSFDVDGICGRVLSSEGPWYLVVNERAKTAKWLILGDLGLPVSAAQAYEGEHIVDPEFAVYGMTEKRARRIAPARLPMASHYAGTTTRWNDLAGFERAQQDRCTLKTPLALLPGVCGRRICVTHGDPVLQYKVQRARDGPWEWEPALGVAFSADNTVFHLFDAVYAVAARPQRKYTAGMFPNASLVSVEPGTASVPPARGDDWYHEDEPPRPGGLRDRFDAHFHYRWCHRCSCLRLDTQAAGRVPLVRTVVLARGRLCRWCVERGTELVDGGTAIAVVSQANGGAPPKCDYPFASCWSPVTNRWEESSFFELCDRLGPALRPFYARVFLSFTCRRADVGTVLFVRPELGYFSRDLRGFLADLFGLIPGRVDEHGNRVDTHGPSSRACALDSTVPVNHPCRSEGWYALASLLGSDGRPTTPVHVDIYAYEGVSLYLDDFSPGWRDGHPLGALGCPRVGGLLDLPLASDGSAGVLVTAPGKYLATVRWEDCPFLFSLMFPNLDPDGRLCPERPVGTAGRRVAVHPKVDYRTVLFFADLVRRNGQLYHEYRCSQDIAVLVWLHQRHWNRHLLAATVTVLRVLYPCKGGLQPVNGALGLRSAEKWFLIIPDDRGAIDFVSAQAKLDRFGGSVRQALAETDTPYPVLQQTKQHALVRGPYAGWGDLFGTVAMVTPSERLGRVLYRAANPSQAANVACTLEVQVAGLRAIVERFAEDTKGVTFYVERLEAHPKLGLLHVHFVASLGPGCDLDLKVKEFVAGLAAADVLRGRRVDLASHGIDNDIVCAAAKDLGDYQPGVASDACLSALLGGLETAVLTKMVKTGLASRQSILDLHDKLITNCVPEELLDPADQGRQGLLLDPNIAGGPAAAQAPAGQRAPGPYNRRPRDAWADHEVPEGYALWKSHVHVCSESRHCVESCANGFPKPLQEATALSFDHNDDTDKLTVRVCGRRNHRGTLNVGRQLLPIAGGGSTDLQLNCNPPEQNFNYILKYFLENSANQDTFGPLEFDVATCLKLVAQVREANPIKAGETPEDHERRLLFVFIYSRVRDMAATGELSQHEMAFRVAFSAFTNVSDHHAASRIARTKLVDDQRWGDVVMFDMDSVAAILTHFPPTADPEQYQLTSAVRPTTGDEVLVLHYWYRRRVTWLHRASPKTFKNVQEVKALGMGGWKLDDFLARFVGVISPPRSEQTLGSLKYRSGKNRKQRVHPVKVKGSAGRPGRTWVDVGRFWWRELLRFVPWPESGPLGVVDEVFSGEALAWVSNADGQRTARLPLRAEKSLHLRVHRFLLSETPPTMTYGFDVCTRNRGLWPVFVKRLEHLASRESSGVDWIIGVTVPKSPFLYYGTGTDGTLGKIVNVALFGWVTHEGDVSDDGDLSGVDSDGSEEPDDAFVGGPAVVVLPPEGDLSVDELAELNTEAQPDPNLTQAMQRHPVMVDRNRLSAPSDPDAGKNYSKLIDVMNGLRDTLPKPDDAHPAAITWTARDTDAADIRALSSALSSAAREDAVRSGASPAPPIRTHLRGVDVATLGHAQRLAVATVQHAVGLANAALTKSDLGSGQLVTITGPPGTGKTRTIDAIVTVVEALRTQGPRVLRCVVVLTATTNTCSFIIDGRTVMIAAGLMKQTLKATLDAINATFASTGMKPGEAVIITWVLDQYSMLSAAHFGLLVHLLFLSDYCFVLILAGDPNQLGAVQCLGFVEAQAAPAAIDAAAQRRERDTLVQQLVQKKKWSGKVYGSIGATFFRLSALVVKLTRNYRSLCARPEVPQPTPDPNAVLSHGHLRRQNALKAIGRQLVNGPIDRAGEAFVLTELSAVARYHRFVRAYRLAFPDASIEEAVHAARLELHQLFAATDTRVITQVHASSTYFNYAFLNAQSRHPIVFDSRYKHRKSWARAGPRGGATKAAEVEDSDRDCESDAEAEGDEGEEEERGAKEVEGADRGYGSDMEAEGDYGEDEERGMEETKTASAPQRDSESDSESANEENMADAASGAIGVVGLDPAALPDAAAPVQVGGNTDEAREPPGPNSAAPPTRPDPRIGRELLGIGGLFRLRVNLCAKWGLTAGGGKYTLVHWLFLDGQCPPDLPAIALVVAPHYTGPQLIPEEMLERFRRLPQWVDLVGPDREQFLIPIKPSSGGSRYGDKLPSGVAALPISGTQAEVTNSVQGETLPANVVVDLGVEELFCGATLVSLSRSRDADKLLVVFGFPAGRLSGNGMMDRRLLQTRRARALHHALLHDRNVLTLGTFANTTDQAVITALTGTREDEAREAMEITEWNNMSDKFDQIVKTIGLDYSAWFAQMTLENQLHTGLWDQPGCQCSSCSTPMTRVLLPTEPAVATSFPEVDLLFGLNQLARQLHALDQDSGDTAAMAGSVGDSAAGLGNPSGAASSGIAVLPPAVPGPQWELCGLANGGNQCWLNVVLQLLAALPDVANMVADLRSSAAGVSGMKSIFADLSSVRFVSAPRVATVPGNLFGLVEATLLVPEQSGRQQDASDGLSAVFRLLNKWREAAGLGDIPVSVGTNGITQVEELRCRGCDTAHFPPVVVTNQLMVRLQSYQNPELTLREFILTEYGNHWTTLDQGARCTVCAADTSHERRLRLGPWASAACPVVFISIHRFYSVGSEVERAGNMVRLGFENGRIGW